MKKYDDLNLLIKLKVLFIKIIFSTIMSIPKYIYLFFKIIIKNIKAILKYIFTGIKVISIIISLSVLLYIFIEMKWFMFLCILLGVGLFIAYNFMLITSMPKKEKEKLWNAKKLSNKLLCREAIMFIYCMMPPLLIRYAIITENGVMGGFGFVMMIIYMFILAYTSVDYK
jgi:hypothetical protein